jgi:hypothetical protein
MKEYTSLAYTSQEIMLPLAPNDEKVVAVAAVEGHPLLMAPCVAAARQSRFSPTLCEGKPVKVTGVIQYNFMSK